MEQFRASGAGKGGKPQASTKARGLPLVGDLSVLQARQARQLSSSPARRPGHRNRTDWRCRGRERLASSSHSSAHPVSSSAESPTAAVSQGRIARIARIAKRAAPSLPANAPAKVGSVRGARRRGERMACGGRMPRQACWLLKGAARRARKGVCLDRRRRPSGGPWSPGRRRRLRGPKDRKLRGCRSEAELATPQTGEAGHAAGFRAKARAGCGEGAMQPRGWRTGSRLWRLPLAPVCPVAGMVAGPPTVRDSAGIFAKHDAKH